MTTVFTKDTAVEVVNIANTTDTIDTVSVRPVPPEPVEGQLAPPMPDPFIGSFSFPIARGTYKSGDRLTYTQSVSSGA